MLATRVISVNNVNGVNYQAVAGLRMYRETHTGTSRTDDEPGLFLLRADPLSLLPTHKADVSRAEALVALGYPGVAPVLPILVDWMQDPEWPVAQVLLPLLAGIGAPLAPHVSHVLGSGNKAWINCVLSGVVAESEDLRKIFRTDFERFQLEVARPAGPRVPEHRSLPRGRG